MIFYQVLMCFIIHLYALKCKSLVQNTTNITQIIDNPLGIHDRAGTSILLHFHLRLGPIFLPSVPFWHVIALSFLSPLTCLAWEIT